MVNNAAGALVLALNALAAGREVLISRGELIEIGGSFRIPDIMARSGARLREVGTTNRTHLEDYRRALDADVAAILTVHRSNFEQRGFVASPEPAALAALAADAGVPYLYDVGSGLLADLSPWGLTSEPRVADAVAAGAGLVLFSGDKLLGGPQAGCLVGTDALVARCRENPLARALRADKLTLAALRPRSPCTRIRHGGSGDSRAAHAHADRPTSWPRQPRAWPATVPPELRAELQPGESRRRRRLVPRRGTADHAGRPRRGSARAGRAGPPAPAGRPGRGGARRRRSACCSTRARCPTRWARRSARALEQALQA